MKTNTFDFDSSKLESSIIAFGLGAASVGAAGYVVLNPEFLVFDQPAKADPSPEVVAVIKSATDTIPVLSGLCMTVFAAGLAPWAARTALSWMSSIMKGAI